MSLSVQINQIDYILSPPGPLDRSDLPSVPVLRIYGHSSTGQQTCLHVHQVFPYCFIEYLGKLHPQHVKCYIKNLKQSLNHAIALSLKRDPYSPKSQYVRAIFLVKGIKFYGFHSAYSPFLKLLFGDPAIVNRATALLQSGSIMSQKYQVYENHLNFLMQFMCDFGLYGCGLIELSDAYLRRDPDDDDVPTIPLKPSPYSRQTRMALELDALAPHIMNRNRLSERNLHHTLQIPGPDLPSEPFVSSIRELWDDERNRRREKGLNPSPELPVDPSEASRQINNEWMAEARWWDEIRMRLEKETPVERAIPDSSPCWEAQVMSAFESIEALWDKQWRNWKPRGQGDNQIDNVDHEVNELSAIEEGSKEDGEVDVDEVALVREGLDQLSEYDEGQDDGDETEEDDADSLTENTPEVEQGHGDHAQSLNMSDEGYPVAPDLMQARESPNPFLDSGTPHPQKPNLFSTARSSKKFAYSPDRDEEIRKFGDIRNLRPGTQEIESRDPAVSQESISPPDAQLCKNSSLRTTTRFSIAHNLPGSTSLTNAYQRCKMTNKNWYIYSVPPPSTSELRVSFVSLNLPTMTYQSPFYSNEKDIHEKGQEFAGLFYHLKGGHGIAFLDQFYTTTTFPTFEAVFSDFQFRGQLGWEYARLPPSQKEVVRWCGKGSISSQRRRKLRSQIEGPSQSGSDGFKVSPLRPATTSSRGKGNMTIMSLEVMAQVDDEKAAPDPEENEVLVAIYAFQVTGKEEIHTGIISVHNAHVNPKRIRGFQIDSVDTELDLLNRVTDLVIDLDPDILTGWQIQNRSWGYLDSRAKQYGFDWQDFISRAPRRRNGGDGSWGARNTTTLQVAGRHVLNTWRIMRTELALTSYTLSNVAFHVLRQRIPKYSATTLSSWYNSPVLGHVSNLLRYLLTCACVTLRILEQTEIIPKTVEFARIFGVDFYSVLSRGSQLKVESFMFRIAKPENFILLSPNKKDVGKQNAAECMPLIMEPMSAFYSSPLIVLDFQSLYPSVMIAYNYCYSTCLGRIKPFQEEYKLGTTKLDLPPGILETLRDHIIVAPNGIMYVKSEVRKGLLGRMLSELLETRVMVKEAMKGSKTDKALTRVLNARQLALKYIANVTYGYTSATFSGRMPAVEIADSIVQTGRETLEKAIELVHSNKKWGGKVVYGDTDSLFIYLPGKTRDQAFRIGNEIANAVTSQNPVPIKLKFEKVYHPCVLLAKKRYVGFKYEATDDKVPIFDAKGIETVRRDGVLAQRKLVENSLRIFFQSQDLTKVKNYCCNSWYKIMENIVSVQDFVFAKEVRLGTYSQKRPPPPGVVVAARRMMLDANDEPQYGERVPYVIIRGETGTVLAERALDPLEMVNDSYYQIDATYYITRVLIPPLERIFNLVGADVKQWFTELPKAKNTTPNILASPSKHKLVAVENEGLVSSPGKWVIEEHLGSTQCLSCGQDAFSELCEDCCVSRQSTISTLEAKTNEIEGRVTTLHQVCVSCSGIAPAEPVECESLDCPLLYARKRAEQQLEMAENIEFLVDGLDSREWQALFFGSEPDETSSESAEM